MKYTLRPKVKRRLTPTESYVEFIIDAQTGEQRDEIMWLIDNALKGNKKEIWDAINEVAQYKKEL